MIELTVSEAGRRTAVRCEALLFDMDGTLVDSRSCVEGIWRAWAARHGLDGDRLMELAHGRQNHETIRLVAPHLDAAAEIAILEPAEEQCREGIVAVPGAIELLGQLPVERWAVVTSAWRRLAEIRLHAAGLPVPPVTVTADDVSRSKPHPEGFLMAAARLGVSPSGCVVLEDSPAGAEAGRAAGMRVIGITTTFPRERLGCEWGVADFRALTVSSAVACP